MYDDSVRKFCSRLFNSVKLVPLRSSYDIIDTNSLSLHSLIYLTLISLYRSDTIEPILSLSLFPTDFPVKDKVKKWVRIFSGFDKVEIKALEKILEQKQRYSELLDLTLLSL